MNLGHSYSGLIYFYCFYVKRRLINALIFAHATISFEAQMTTAILRDQRRFVDLLQFGSDQRPLLFYKLAVSSFLFWSQLDCSSRPLLT